MLICGTKDQYRQLRDMHTLETRIKEVKITVAKGGFDFSDMSGSAVGVSLQYDTLIQLIEQLKTCVEVAESRTLNWQRFCVSDETVLPFLLQVWLEVVLSSYSTICSQVSYLLDNGVSPLVLQLLQGALCPQTARDHGRWGLDDHLSGTLTLTLTTRLDTLPSHSNCPRSASR